MHGQLIIGLNTQSRLLAFFVWRCARDPSAVTKISQQNSGTRSITIVLMMGPINNLYVRALRIGAPETAHTFF